MTGTAVSLTLAAAGLAELHDALYPGDGRESAALVLCGRHEYEGRHRLLGHRVFPVPDSAYVRRERDRLTWKTAFTKPLLQDAAMKRLAVLKVHSHPGGYAAFSPTDDAADAALFPSIFGWLDDGLPHGSAILLPGGDLLGRAHFADRPHAPFSSITIVGDDIQIRRPGGETVVSAAGERTAQVFGERTYAVLRALRVAVVGCSGTGSYVIDLLSKLEVGELVLVDDDRVERRNLNRILGATMRDIGRPKVDVLKDHVENLGLGTRVTAIPRLISHSEARHAVASADVAFGCVDSIDGRHLLNRLATFFNVAYFDIGVRLIADGRGGIDQVCGSVHYLQPGLSSLTTRGLYTHEGVRAAYLLRADPASFEAERRERYIEGVDVGRPAVAPVNSAFSARAVLELLSRLHPYKLDGNSEFASVTTSFSGGFEQRKAEREYEIDAALAPHVGRGDASPPLEMPLLSA